MMNENIKTVSVIIPIYKVEQYLDQCIDSVIHQEYRHLEIILVDDGSPDGCPQMCDDWALKDSRIKVIHKKNGGLSDARNAGLDICTGDYISFIDSDDWIKSDMYKVMVNAIEKEGADICACNIISCYPDKEIIWGGKKYTVGTSEEILKLLYSDTAFPVCSWNKLYRRQLWEEFRFPKGKICEDAFTTYRLIDKAKRIVHIIEALYYYRIRSDSIMTSAFSRKSMDEEEAWRENYLFIKEYYPKVYRKAYSFYLQSVNTLIQRISKKQRKLFREEFNYLRSIIFHNLFFMLFQSTVNIKYRIKFLYDFINL